MNAGLRDASTGCAPLQMGRRRTIQIGLDHGSNRRNDAANFLSPSAPHTYRLSNGRLHCEQVIENRSSEPLPFATGFHPYFAVPLTARSERAACFVEIPDGKRMTQQGRAEAFTSKPFPAQNWSVQEDVSETLFLANLKKQELVLIDPVSELEVVFNFEEAPQHRFVALWAKTPNEPFYCLEPWTALPNAFSRPKDHGSFFWNPRRRFAPPFGWNCGKCPSVAELEPR